MSQDEHLKQAKQRQQLEKELRRVSKRLEWRLRRLLDFINSVLVAWAVVGTGTLLLNLVTGFKLGDWLGVEIDEWYAGMAFFLPMLLLGGIRTLFSRWEDEHTAVYFDHDVVLEVEQAEAAWDAQDAADERRWQERESVAGAVSVVTVGGQQGELSAAGEEGELTITDNSKVKRTE